MTEFQVRNVGAEVQAMLLSHYGKKVVTTAYIAPTPGHIWIFSNRTGMGFVRVNGPEWSWVDEEVLLKMQKNKKLRAGSKPQRFFEDLLPCTFEEFVAKVGSIEDLCGPSPYCPCEAGGVYRKK